MDRNRSLQLTSFSHAEEWGHHGGVFVGFLVFSCAFIAFRIQFFF
jgi:hypothetical protein